MEIDVLVIGFGAAGTSAALAGHEAGASVLIAEKTAAGGGNCRHSGGFLFEAEGPTVLDHLDALCFGKTPRAVLEAYVGGLAEVSPWLQSLGGRTAAVDMAAFGGMLPSWPNFPGAGQVGYRQYVGDGTAPGIALWERLERAVREREVPVSLNTGAVELIIDGDAVRGAVLDGPGGREQVHAGAVVLASGGIEYDADMRDGYLPLPLVPVGHPGNTGDTVRLAQQAGASLWHMSAFFGWLAHARPEFPAAFTLDVHAPSFIYIDGDGRRFADETGWEVHDKVRCWTAFLPRNANHPHLPGYIIFDEAARRAGPLHGIVGSPNDYAWSADNSREVDAGWIARGETAAESAAAIGVDTTTLAETLAAYDMVARAGRDDAFNRSPDSLAALEPPLYAIEMRPGLATASGGPRRDELACVLTPAGDPIDGLYAAGGAGSIWGHLTEHGGGLTDAIVFGRIAGAHAASLAPASASR